MREAEARNRITTEIDRQQELGNIFGPLNPPPAAAPPPLPTLPTRTNLDRQLAQTLFGEKGFGLDVESQFPPPTPFRQQIGADPNLQTRLNFQQSLQPSFFQQPRRFDITLREGLDAIDGRAKSLAPEPQPVEGF